MNSGKVVLGVLTGVAVGAIMGILFAPDKGTTTRRKLIEKGDDYVDELNDKFNDFMETINEKFAAAKEDADDLIAKAKAKTQEVKNTVSSKMDHQS